MSIQPAWSHGSRLPPGLTEQLAVRDFVIDRDLFADFDGLGRLYEQDRIIVRGARDGVW